MVRGVDGLAVVGVYEDVVDHGGDEGEDEYGGDFGPGVLDPCVDAFWGWVGEYVWGERVGGRTFPGESFWDGKHSSGPWATTLVNEHEILKR